MGKGDKKTRRGKIISGSYGKTRPRKTEKAAVRTAEKPVKVAKPATEKKQIKPKTVKAKAETTEDVVAEKPKTTRKKKTEE